MNIRKCVKNDSQAICNIYNYYIENSAITFEETVVSDIIMSKRIEGYTKKYPWLVLENTDGIVVGYAFAKKWSERSAYKNTAEISVYLHKNELGHGYGVALYEELLFALLASGFHTVIATITLPNDASVKFHESFGFNQVSHFKEIGYKFGKWIDVGHWQKQLRK